jgi:hypothetical protein
MRIVELSLNKYPIGGFTMDKKQQQPSRNPSTTTTKTPNQTNKPNQGTPSKTPSSKKPGSNW